MSFKVNSSQQISFNDSVFSLTAREKKALLKRQGSVRFRLIAIIALVVHTKGSIVQKSMDGMQHSLLQRMLQTGQRAKGICKVKNSAIMQSLGMA